MISSDPVKVRIIIYYILSKSLLMKLDPAIERWSHMVICPSQNTQSAPNPSRCQRENTYQNFQFTSRATTRVMLWALLVPVATGFLFVRYDVSPVIYKLS